MPSGSPSPGEEAVTLLLITMTATIREITNITPHTPMMMTVRRLNLSVSTKFQDTAEPAQENLYLFISTFTVRMFLSKSLIQRNKELDL